MELEIYDTTLRDGSQQEGISLTVSDKLRIAGLLDELGVAFVEGGWPLISELMDEHCRVVVDIKGVLPREEKPDGVALWRL